MSVSGETSCARRGVPAKGFRGGVPVRPAFVLTRLEVPVTLMVGARILVALIIVLLLRGAGGL